MTRTAIFPDEFDYALVPATSAEPGAGVRIHDSLFAVQDDLAALPPWAGDVPMHVLHREIPRWRRFDDPGVEAGIELEFTLGYGYYWPGDDVEQLRPRPGATATVSSIDEARQNLSQALDAMPDDIGRLTILCRPRCDWTPPVGATAAVAAVREHMVAATTGDVDTLRRGAIGTLLDAMTGLTDEQLIDAVCGAYVTAPTVLVLVRDSNRPGHHHVLTNSTLHFDVDDSTGRWLVRQVRLMERTDQFGTFPWCWRPGLAAEHVTG